MKKVLVLVLALILTFAMSLNAFAAPGKSNQGNGKGASKSTQHVPKSNVKNQIKQDKNDASMKKQFKQEMNEAKKTIATQKGDLEAERTELQNQYELLSNTPEPTDPVAAAERATALADLQSQMSALDNELTSATTQMKQIINERFMIMKAQYTAAELEELGITNVEDLIAKLYQDAYAPENVAMTVKKNQVRLEAPPYIKGGKIIFPIRAITEGMGGQVSWKEEDKSVTVTKDGITVVFTINSTTATVTRTVPQTPTEDEAPLDDSNIEEGADETVPPLTEIVEMDVPVEITCGRAYVPLKYLAEVFGIEATYDADTQSLEIEQPTPADPDASDPAVIPEDTTDGSGADADENTEL